MIKQKPSAIDVDEAGRILEKLGSLTATIGAVEAQLDRRIVNLEEQLVRSVVSLKEASALALAAQDKTTAVAQATADRAVAKAEAAAGKEYLESQIDGLRNTLSQQIVAQKEAINAALVSAKDALTAALTSAEKAIAKAEDANEKRFQSVNEFRAQLGDQQKTFVVKSEVDYRFETVNIKLDEVAVWRRTVDAALTAASSKSGLIYAALALVISLGILTVAILNFVSKAHP